MTDEYRYVDPVNILDTNAQSLTPEETAIQMQDSFRRGRQFIRSAIDPVLPVLQNQYLNLIKLLDDETQGKYTVLLDQLRKHFNRPDRPFEAICFHLFQTPSTIKGNDGKEYPHYGWAKCRGEFSSFAEMESEIQAVMQDHDTYTRTTAFPKGAFFPITVAPLEKMEDVEHKYDQDIKNASDMRQKIIEMERKREEILLKMQEDAEPGSLEDYIRQKLRLCVAETKIERARLDTEKFKPILEKQTSVVGKMETEHPNYFKDGLKLYQEKMEEIGFPKPGSYYDGCIGTGMM